MLAIGIDCAQTSGWAVIENAGGRGEKLIRHGVLRMKGRPPAEQYRAIARLAAELLDHHPDIVAIELPHLNKNAHVLQVLARLCGAYELAFCSCQDVRVVDPTQWRTTVLGPIAGGMKRPQLKAFAMRWCRGVYGVDLPEDAAEAAGLARYALSQVLMQHRAAQLSLKTA